MPRNASGTYTLPSAAFVATTVIASAAVNLDMSDIATALTQSLATTGVTPMTGPILGASGSVAAPSYTFNTVRTAGWYLSGANEISIAINSAQTAKFNSAGLTAVASNFIDSNNNIIYGTPVGIISPYGGTAAPTLWLLCSGVAVSRTTYALLFAAIGTNFGVGDGTTTFNVPDLRGRAPFGKDDMGGTAANRITNAGSGIVGTTLGATGGGQNVTILQANLPNTNLTVTDPTHTHSLGGTNVGLASGSSIISGGGGGLNTVTISIVANSTGITVASGGSGTALASMNPALITNYIIFAGV